ncbi:DUF58 domain-containing protein [Flavobacteriaceae bacterium D16]|nr:DUF58 domain-containing protein [Flavobacteriaceae bacterium D16]
MHIPSELHKAPLFQNLELLARQVVEGFISGIHKSPFHGFSAEFAEHKIYNTGESTRHIDWKLFAKTDKLYTKRYEEETNLRCHMILDNSASMYYPDVKKLDIDHLNKIGYSVLAIAALMNILKKQRDAVGLSVYSDSYNFYTPEKGSERHHHMLLSKLSEISLDPSPPRETRTYTFLHQIAEKIKRRSLIFLFTDMFQTTQDNAKLFDALRHLKYNKHEVVLFHLLDYETEAHFNFENTPKRFVDVETGQHIDVYPEELKASYEAELQDYIRDIKLKCGQYKIKYVGVDIQDRFQKVLNTFLIERQKFV